MEPSEEKDILDKVLSNYSRVPTAEVPIERLDTTFVVKGLRSKEEARVRERATRTKLNRRTGRREHDFDVDLYTRLLIVEATTNFDWNADALKERTGEVAPEDIVGELLLFNEQITLFSVIDQLSGDSDLPVDDIKN